MNQFQDFMNESAYSGSEYADLFQLITNLNGIRSSLEQMDHYYNNKSYLKMESQILQMIRELKDIRNNISPVR